MPCLEQNFGRNVEKHFPRFRTKNIFDIEFNSIYMPKDQAQHILMKDVFNQYFFISTLGSVHGTMVLRRIK